MWFACFTYFMFSFFSFRAFFYWHLLLLHCLLFHFLMIFLLVWKLYVLCFICIPIIFVGICIPIIFIIPIVSIHQDSNVCLPSWLLFILSCTSHLHCVMDDDLQHFFQYGSVQESLHLSMKSLFLFHSLFFQKFHHENVSFRFKSILSWGRDSLIMLYKLCHRLLASLFYEKVSSSLESCSFEGHLFLLPPALALFKTFLFVIF